MSGSSKKMYGNYKVFHPNGNLMFFCDKKRYKWYLNRELADVIDDKSIILTFEPKGFGEPDTFLTPRENKCVVTGLDENLTKHHVIPYQFRKHFPTEYKSRNANDVVAITYEKHHEYERHADILKASLIEEHISQSEIDYNIALSYVTRFRKTIDKHAEVIPQDKLLNIQKHIQENLDTINMTLEEAKTAEVIDFSTVIVDRVGIENLIVMWKKHFLEYAKPKYLPKWWDENYIKII